MELNTTKETEMSATKILQIPDAWLMGFCQALPGRPERTIQQAVAYWIQQDEMAAQWRLQRDAARLEAK